jgi:hypothetical protein
MTTMRIIVPGLLLLALTLPASAKTYKSSYSVPCSDVWSAVKDTLSNPDNHYEVVENDDAAMKASYNVKHAAHVTISGAILQRTNRVALVPQGADACEMQVVSNWSGIEHSDRTDFKTRVDESLAKLKTAAPVPPAAPAEVVPPQK